MRPTSAALLAVWYSVVVLCRASLLVGPNGSLVRLPRQSCRFKCSSGECLDEDKKCDGSKDCPDGSDETAETCRNMNCPGYAIRCDYGGCVDGDAQCNGVADCADSSDELHCPGPQPVKRCKKGEFECSSGSCILNTDLCDGMIHCPDGSDENEAACKNFPCPVYTFKCRYGACVDRPALCNGIIQCADGSDEAKEQCGSSSSHTTVTRPDLSNRDMVCDPVSSRFQAPSVTACGEYPRYGGRPLILSGETAEAGEIPWHAAIFRFNSETDNYINICGGTLVSARMIISAAHCFWDASTRRPSLTKNFKIVLGKHRYAWGERGENEQRFDVAQIIVNCFYQHSIKYYDDDIAAIILQGEARFSDFVQPICIDWEQKYSPRVTRGKVAGWGLTEQYKVPGSLRRVWVPSVDLDTCKKSFSSRFEPFISRRKFCAGYKNSTGVCNGDSGGGLVFWNADDRRWYLWGIVSAGVLNTTLAEDYCSLKDYALFTDVAMFLPWINLVFT